MESFLKLKKQIKNNNFPNLLVFTGKEKEVMKKYINNIDSNYTVVDNFIKVKNQLSSKSLFSSNSTYVVKNDNDILKSKYKEIKNVIGDNTLILIYDKIDKRKKLFKSSIIYEFKEIENSYKYVQDILNCSDRIAKLVSNRCRNDIRLIELECDKLINLHEIGYEITYNLCTQCVSSLPQDKIWDFITYLLIQNPKALNLFSDLKTLKYNEIQLATIMYKKFRNYVILKASPERNYNKIMDKTGLKYHQVKYGMLDLKKCNQSLEQLANKLLLIQDFEYGVKTGKVQMEKGFKKLLLNLLKEV